MGDRERIGFAFFTGNARESLDRIERAEAAGVGTIWLVMPALGQDTLTLLAAAAVSTERITFGTAIVPAFTRHPLGMATQVLTLEDLAPGRLRLGIGTAHQRTMQPVFGFPFDRPLTQLREYVNVLRPVLQTGEVTFRGDYYSVDAKLAYAAGTPVLISALRENAFEMAGEITDGAITWLCPMDYLVKTAKPALQRGAAAAGRSAPPLVAHTLVAPRTDRDAIRRHARETLNSYAQNVFYRRMFADSGFPVGEPGSIEIPDGLIDALVVSGDEREVADGLRARLALGMDELVVSLVPSDDPRADEETIFRIIAGM